MTQERRTAYFCTLFGLVFIFGVALFVRFNVADYGFPHRQDGNEQQDQNLELKTFDNIANHPISVQCVVEHLKTIKAGCSIEDFELVMSKTGIVSNGPVHYKDLHYFWTINTFQGRGYPQYYVRGWFLSDKGWDFSGHLVWATVDVVDEAHEWRTIWLIEYQQSKSHPPWIRGLHKAVGK